MSATEQDRRLDFARQILQTADGRRSGFALPLPASVANDRQLAAEVLDDLLRRAYLVERPIFPNEAFWLPQGDARTTILVITALGQRALAAEPETQALPRSEDGRIVADDLPIESSDISMPGRSSSLPRGKLGVVLSAVSRPGGCSLGELVQLTGWKEPSLRSALSTGLRKHGVEVALLETASGKRYVRSNVSI